MLRVLAESFVVSPPSGVTIKTRLRPTPAEEQALREVGTFLGSLYRADLVRRLGEGKLDAQVCLRVQAWECLWAHRRMFLSADGESGKRFGNETIRVDHTGHLSVKVPG